MVMRYIKFLAAAVALIVASACVNSNIDDMPIISVGSNGDLQIVGRVTQYSDCDVATRSKKEGDEPKVTSMGLALFPIENGTIGYCVYYDFQLGGSIVFIVDRHDDIFKDYDDTEFAMYIFANMQDADGFPTTAEEGVGKTLDYFKKCAVATSTDVENVPENGFPMMGSLGHTEGKELILKPTQTATNTDGLPTVNGIPTDNLEIPLRSMYAKFTFTIAVKPDQEIVGNKAPRFDLVEYSVNNIAATVDCASDTNDDNVVIDTSGAVSMGNYAQGATVATFDFYLPERYLSPTKTIDAVLPDELKSASTEEKEKYQQRYKNKLVEDKAATYVTITGKYTDHQENTYDVSYNIYLGENNYDNFNIIRNTHYDNSVTIRGISASDDQSANKEGISIDHRVNVNRSTPLVINLRREGLLDAHYEVRPLRLRLVGETIPTGTSATVEILNQDGTKNNIPGWIGLEASGNSTNHITTDGVSKGKRKYFTTNLLSELNQSITVNNLTGDNQTVWIYVDENTDTKSRAAIVRVSYNGVDKDFEIVQHGLFKVTGADSGRDYYIEQYEEYLYNYDAEDSYGQTKQEGMPWGLYKVQLSNEHNSFTIDEDNNPWNSYVSANPNLLTYDFYTWEQDSVVMKKAGITDKKNDKRWHGYAGQHFTGDIYKKSKGEVRTLTMAEQASGAVEYCYNRNKRQPDGTIKEGDIVWYLPSAGELEDIIVAGYSSFKEFQDNYYWTSQPAFTRNVFYYEYKEAGGFLNLQTITVDAYGFIVYEDNTEYARATKAVSLGNDKYDYARSGLNDEPRVKGTHNDNKVTDTLGYFKTWNQWKKPKSGDAVTTPVYTNQVYNEIINEKETGRRYYAFVNINYFDPEYDYGMLQDGYQKRTKSNRVRCVRAKPTTSN